MANTETERARYEELLQELRVMLPGVEVLFAFLLTAVFAQRFQELDGSGRFLFAVALLASAVTVLLLLVPAALHRLSNVDRDSRVDIAARFQVFASVTLGISMCVALLVVMRFVFGTAIGLLAAGVLAVVWVGLWYVFPLQLRRRWD